MFALAPGAWHGPIESAYGLHLVRISAITPAAQRPFSEVRNEVLERWREVQRQDAEKRYFAELFKKYQIIIDDSVKPLVGTPAADLE